MITFTDEFGNDVEYERLLSFKSKKNNKVYFVFTDNILNEKNEQNLYCYYIKLDDQENKFYPVNGEELDMVKGVYERIKGDNNAI